uniref:Odorant receptor n=1 Tax=Lobesia botrana TaxID=209534 RepID=A0A345BEU9_9NEOP|nr:odorant receptors OR20 [Lobesia botrana]
MSKMCKIKYLNENNNAKKYKSFNETFRICAFALAFGLIYPNKSNMFKRMFLFFLVLLFHFGTLFWFIWYTIKCLVKLDIYNSTRNITVGVIIVLFVLKTIYADLKTDMFADLLKQISKDLLNGNYMEDDYQEIYDYYIKQGMFGQRSYIVIPLVLSSIFPVYSGSAMIYGSLKSDVFKKYMLHEMDIKYLEDKQYDSPYFELVYAYYTIGIYTLVPNFTGFDGSFCIATSHLRMKLKLMTHRVKRAFRDSNNVLELNDRLKDCVKDHQEALQFYDLIQNLYGGWLFAVFILTSFLISCNLYQIYLTGVDPRYTIFALTGAFHMYMPCYFASCLIELGEEVATDLYFAEWEIWSDPTATKMLVFIIARSQKRLVLTGLGIVTFNMETFVSLMQTSYSFFTLITSK